MSASSEEDQFEAHPVTIELNENLKSKLVHDLSSICEVPEAEARSMLEAHNWNIQVAIDTFLDACREDVEDMSDEVIILPPEPPKVKLPAATITLDDDDDDDITERSVPVGPPSASNTSTSAVAFGDVGKFRKSGGFSRLAPEKFSVLSWNLDGLDDKNLDKRTHAVIDLIDKEEHDILFFQELIPVTFDYIARKLGEKYFPVIGTTNPDCQYFTATFLRLNKVYHEDDYIIPFPNTSMDRNLLVTKAFIGQAKLFLLNTHLESTADFAGARKAQLQICLDHSAAFPPEYNVIFGGDLNLRDKEVEGVLPETMCDVWAKCGSRETCRYTWDLTRNTNKQMPGKFQPRCRFDRLYFRDSTPPTLTPEFFGVTGIEKVEGTQSFPSDHWAIISFFRLSEEARQPAKSDAEGGKA